jgi:hypothetical protein
MTKFQVTLNFSFEAHDVEDYRDNAKAKKAKKRAFERTAKYYKDHDIIEYIKSNDAMGMVEYVLCDGEVLSAEWDAERFAIHMVVDTDQTADELRRDLEMNSLEDGEYEACGESGWILFTRDEEGNVHNGGLDSEDVWEYGLVDYRQNPIVIQVMPHTS